MRICGFIWMIFSGFLALGQQLTGHVVDETGEPLIGAHVYSVKNWRDGAITDSSGKFDLRLTQPTDSLIVSYVGFQEQTVAVDAVSEIVLKELSASAGTVVVEARSLVAEEFKYMEIQRMDMYNNPSAQADPILAVNMLPAATTVDESANISLRGSSPFETGIYLNSVPVYDAVRYAQLNGLGTFSIFTPTILKSVDVFPGNPPIELGNSTSGAIALTTDESIVGDPVNSVVISLANVGISREQPLGKNQSLKFFSNWQMSGPIKQLNKKALDEVNRFNSNDLGLYYYAVLGKMNIKVLSYSIFEGYETKLEHPSFDGPFELNKCRNFTISTLEMPVGRGTIALQNGVSFSKGTYSYSSADFEVDKSDLFLGINYQQQTGKLYTKAGLSSDSRASAVKGSFHQMEYALAPSHPLLFLDATTGVKVLDMYAYGKYIATEQLTLGGGIRKNIPNKTVSSYLSGQLNAAFSIVDWTITAGLGSYHKNGLEENSGEYFRSAARQASIDFQYSPNNTLVSLSIFRKQGEVQSNSYSATGFEAYLNHRFSKRFRTTGTFTLIQTRSVEGQYRDDPGYFFRHSISYSPGKMWEFTSNLLIREGTVASTVEGASYDEALDVYVPIFLAGGERLNTYANLSLGVNKFFAVSENFVWIAFVSVNNLLDRENARSFSFNREYTQRKEDLFSQRTLYFGVVLNF